MSSQTNILSGNVEQFQHFRNQCGDGARNPQYDRKVLLGRRLGLPPDPLSHVAIVALKLIGS